MIFRTRRGSPKTNGRGCEWPRMILCRLGWSLACAQQSRVDKRMVAATWPVAAPRGLKSLGAGAISRRQGLGRVQFAVENAALPWRVLCCDLPPLFCPAFDDIRRHPRSFRKYPVAVFVRMLSLVEGSRRKQSSKVGRAQSRRCSGWKEGAARRGHTRLDCCRRRV